MAAPAGSGSTEDSGPKPGHQNGSVDPTRPGPGPRLPHRSPSPAASTPLRTLRTAGGLVSPATDPGPAGRSGSVRPRGLSLGSRIRVSRTKRSSHQQEEPEALLDLVLQCQGQRLEDQRASLSLLPDPGPDSLCGACGPDQVLVPGLDLYYMLIQYQSRRMDDQRCPLPDREAVPGQEGQEDFFSLVQRLQSRRMDEQRVSMPPRETEEDQQDQEDQDDEQDQEDQDSQQDRDQEDQEDQEAAASSSSLMKVLH